MPRGQDALSFPGSLENSGGNRGYEKAVGVAVTIRGAVILGEQEGASRTYSLTGSDVAAVGTSLPTPSPS